MHELPVTENILKVVLRHAEEAKAVRVISVSLRIGELSDVIDEWLQRYFDHLSRGTVAEGAGLLVERMPVVFRCEGCGKSFHVNIREVRDVVCPACGGGKASFVSGREFFIKSIEVI
ncbi:MAG TPA: hydrogenase maturation nickel metallochaperone HypA [Syntrophales bacterium]|nr:hydrogenase maturation nickel metallochaperone HypA [Syntrophales bacterium]HOX94677.1 hydrogenase maturation nickel metallochaperone HypA [Syntrophales bacterium]HPI56859.1 hydrogenase maturation nickel metallochaperone HypA [Syntrophales bacterium]HPN23445.1 hydrogenase maturation nickel metallochaperone HypA [Syntrophales bacterium]HQM28030.1 hydrogenase maturation nickel metallochaperone HypA [Syntrophales bacterium]